MTVKELKKILETVDENVKIVVDGYEHLIMDIDESHGLKLLVDLGLGCHTEWHEGYKRRVNGVLIDNVKPITAYYLPFRND